MTPKKKPAPPPMAHPSGTFIAPKQVTDILGISLKTVHEMINDGRLPAVRFSDKPGSSIRILIDDVYAMLVAVVPEAVMSDARSRQPSPLHVPLPTKRGAK
ncbi:MAG: helix-turn-helix domain-containing protein [Mycobacterium sp.]